MEPFQENKIQSKASIRREVCRNSPETQAFREEIILLIENAEPDVAYSIKRDLSIMTDMPFYKQFKKKVKSDKSRHDMIKAYVKLLVDHANLKLAIKLLKALSKNQGQIIRKAVPRIGQRKDV